MLAPGLTLIAQPWIRHRVGLRFTVAVLAILLLAIRLRVPDLGEEWWLLPLSIVAILSAASVYILNAMLFLEREGDLASGYPRRLFVLPTSTSTLVFWPMLLNVATVSALWLLASVVIPYTPVPLPKLLPSLILTAAVSWLQAMAWCPFGAGWYRAVVCMIVYIALVTPPIVAQTVMKLAVPWELMMILYLLGAWGVAYWAVSQARRGDVWMPRIPGVTLFEAASRGFERRRGFGSPPSAQLWYEARCHLWMLPVATLWFLGFFGVVLTFKPLQGDRPGLVTPFLFGIAAATPVVMAMSVTTRLGRFEPFWRSSLPSIEFAGTRPMTTQSLVVAKFRTALASVLLTWVLVVVCSWSRSSAVGAWDIRSIWPEPRPDGTTAGASGCSSACRSSRGRRSRGGVSPAACRRASADADGSPRPTRGVSPSARWPLRSRSSGFSSIAHRSPR